MTSRLRILVPILVALAGCGGGSSKQTNVDGAGSPAIGVDGGGSPATGVDGGGSPATGVDSGGSPATGVDSGSPTPGLDGGVVTPPRLDTALPVSIDGPVVTLDGGFVDGALLDVPLTSDTNGPLDTSAVCTFSEAAMTLPSSFTSDSTLAYRPGCTYHFSGNVSIRSGATLTIEPGVTIEAASGAGIIVNGALSAVGTAAMPIRFVGAQATPGYWDGIIFSNSDNVANVLDHVMVDNAGTMSAGSSSVMLGSVVVNSARVQIKNTTIQGGSGVGLAMRNPTVDAFSGNVITQNALGAVNVDADDVGQLLGTPPSSFVGNTVDAIIVDGETVGTAQTWGALDAPYLVGGTVTINADLVLQAGAKFKMAKEASIYVNGAKGSLNAAGTAGKEIVFLGDQPTRGYWNGIYFKESDNVNNLLDHVVIEHAGAVTTGSSSYPLGSLVVYSARVQIKNTTVRLGSGVGLVLRTPTIDAFSGNTFTQNTLGAAFLDASLVMKVAGDPMSSFADNEVNYIILNGGTVDTEQTWPVFDAPFLVNNDVTVSAALTLTPGATFVFKQGKYLNVSSTGALIAQGLAGKEITFTGEQEQPGYWGGLWFTSTNSASNLIDHAVVSYGGGRSPSSSSRHPANIYVYGSLLTVTNSTITNSADFGIFWDSVSTVTQSGNTFSGNVVDRP